MLNHEHFSHPLFHMMGASRGRRGHGQFGRGFFGGFGGGGPNFGAGRKLNAADLQLLILARLEEKPCHGYELIKEIEERSGGFYSPSPGVIYPALTYLEELGFASVETSGTKKLYSITAEGRQHLDKNRKKIEVMMKELEHIGHRMERMQQFFANEETGEGTVDLRGSEEFAESMMVFRSALRQKHHSTPEEAKRIAEILKRAAAEISGNTDYDS